MFKKSLVFMGLIFFSACSNQNSKNVIGLLGAMDEEIKIVKNQLQNLKTTELGGNTYYQGILSGRNVVLAKTGIGLVNASITTTVMLKKFNVQSLIFIGVSGAITNSLTVGDLVIGTNFIHYDVDHTAFGYDLGHISRETVWKYPADNKLINFVTPIAKGLFPERQIDNGIVISGDKFILDREIQYNLAQEFEASAIDMESSAVAHVAYKFNIPVVVIRAVSDGDGEGNNKEQYEKFFRDAAKNSAKVLITVLESEGYPY